MWRSGTDAGRIGAADGISSRVIFADFSSRMPGKIFRKNSDSLLRIFPSRSLNLLMKLPKPLCGKALRVSLRQQIILAEKNP